MEPLTLVQWMLWPLVGFTVTNTLEPWAKLPVESLPLAQRILSVVLACASAIFVPYMLWRAYQTFGFGHAVTALFVSWIGSLVLIALVFGLYGVYLRKTVERTEQRTYKFEKFRYGHFWLSLFVSLCAAITLFNLYRP